MRTFRMVPATLLLCGLWLFGGAAVAGAATGDFVRQFGSPHVFQQPHGVSVDPATGEIYIAENAVQKITVYSAQGEKLRQWGGYGTGAGQLRSAAGVTFVPGTQEVYVADPTGTKVVVYSREGALLRELHGSTLLPATVQPRSWRPNRVYVRDGRIYLADGQHRIVILNAADGSYVSSFGSQGMLEGQLNNPGDVCADAAGRIYVADTGNNRVQVFDAAGNVLLVLGGDGTAAGFTKGPSGIWVDEASGEIYVTEYGNGRIQVFDSAGYSLRLIGASGSDYGKNYGPRGSARLADGRWIVADALGNRLNLWTPEGAFVEGWGRQGHQAGSFNRPGAIAIHQNGTVFVADNLNYRIQAFERSGGFLFQIGSKGPADNQFNGTIADLEIGAGASGRLYALESSKLKIFEASGAFVKAYTSTQIGFSAVSLARGTPGTIWMLDSYGGRMASYDEGTDSLAALPRLNFSAARDSNGYNVSAFDFIRADNGEIRAVDRQRYQPNTALKVFAADGSFLRRELACGGDWMGVLFLQYPEAIARDAQGNFFIVDWLNRRVSAFARNVGWLHTYGPGASVSVPTPQAFGQPAGVAADPVTGEVYVSDKAMQNVQVLEGVGTITDLPPNVEIPPNPFLTLNEDQSGEYVFRASSADGDATVWEAQGLRAGMVFQNQGDGTALWSWHPGYTDGGDHGFTLSARDQGPAGRAPWMLASVRVQNVNRLPTIDAVASPIVVTAGDLVRFDVVARDPDPNPWLSWTVTNLPIGATFTGSRYSGVASPFVWQTSLANVGSHVVTFQVADSYGGTASLMVTIDVQGAVQENLPPVISVSPQSATVWEPGAVTLSVQAFDANGDGIALSCANPPPGATFADHGDGTGTFSWTTSYASQGVHAILFVAVEQTPQGLSGSAVATVTVQNSNRAPIVADPGTLTVSEGATLSYALQITDPDGEAFNVAVTSLPTGSSFDPLTRTLTWTPSYRQAGSWRFSGRVTDALGGYTDFSHSITVSNVNRAPALDPIADRSANEGERISFFAHAFDPDRELVRYTSASLPAGASLNLYSGEFVWTPTYSQAGVYTVTITAADSSSPPLSDSRSVVITVLSVNGPPQFAPLGAQSVAEGQSLSVTVSAADPDADPLAWEVAGLPPGATFDEGTGLLLWSPDYSQSGTYETTFVVTEATPAAKSATLVVPITVVEVNRVPVFDPIPNQTVNENESLTLGPRATDPDGDPVSVSASGLPAGALFDGATFSWTPNFGQAGTHTVTFLASDGRGGTGQLVLRITVTNINRPPVLAPVGNKSVMENQTVMFTLAATDPDLQTLAYSMSGAPAGASLQPSTGVFTWTPAFNQAGNHAITFTVRDNSSPPGEDSETITITVGNVNGPPAISPLTNRTIAENGLLSFTVTVTDPDGDPFTLAAENLPPGAGFDPLTGAFSWRPGYDQAGVYVVTFRATQVGDPTLTDAEALTITVSNTNRAPVFAQLATQYGAETQPLQFTVSASDPDGDPVTLSAWSGMPAGATFNAATGLFAWTPDYTQGGYHYPRFRASDPSGASGFMTVSVFVQSANRAPTLNPIGPKSVDEGQTLSFTVTATDPDNDALRYFVDNAPAGMSLNAVSGAFSWTPTYDQAGVYALTIRVQDTVSPPLADSEVVTFTVVNRNGPPSIAPLADRTVDEGSPLAFTVVASDPDGDPFTLVAASLPAGAAFDAQTGAFSWTPAFDQAGVHSATFQAFEAGPEPVDSRTVTITVRNLNRPPVLDPIGDRSGTEGQALNFTLTAGDPDAGEVLRFSVEGAPAGAALDAVTGAFSWVPSLEQAGAYHPTFRVTDAAGLGATEAIWITIVESNRPPVLEPIGAKSVAEGLEIAFFVRASDPDGDAVLLEASGLPPGATFDPATGRFSWETGYEDAGVHAVTFSAADDGTPALSATETVEITVENVNRAPVLSPVGDRSVNEGEALTVALEASDPDGGRLALSVSNLPLGATFADRGDGTALFSWTPDYSQGGNYPDVLFRVTDDGVPPRAATEAIGISVGNVNRPPVFVTVPAALISVFETETIAFALAAADPDGDALHFSASRLPAGATFDPSSAAFQWVTTYEDGGVYPDVRFVVTDDGSPALSAAVATTMTVGDVNRPPVLDPIGDRTVAEGETLSFAVTATDPDGDGLAFSAANLPPGASFDPATQVFLWTPDYGQAGVYADVEFAVQDDGAPMELDAELIAVSVGNSNRAPVFDPIPPLSGREGFALTFTVRAVDYDGDAFVYAAEGALPAHASFDPLTGVFAWVPDFGQAGTFVLRFSATDDGAPAPAVGTTAVVVSIGTTTVEELVADLVETVLAMQLPHPVENAFLANLKKVMPFVAAGRVNPAVNQLEAVVHKAEQFVGQGAVTASQGEAVASRARRILGLLR